MPPFTNRPVLSRTPAINPGLLRHQIVISTYTVSAPDAFGNTVKLYSTPGYTCWARIDSAKEAQTTYGQSFITESSHVITMRFDPAFTPTPNMVVSYNVAQYTINSVSNYNERNIFYTLECTVLEAH